MKYQFVIIALVLCVHVCAQSVSISGKVIDYHDNLPIPGATVYLQSLTDSSNTNGTITDFSGCFNIECLPGRQILSVSFMGFNSYVDTLSFTDSMVMSTIKLIEENKLLDEINVVNIVTPTYFKGDTAIYNPDAFKVNLDATANDLLLKMPGFYDVDGKMLAMGDTIKEVLVDGKRFFGSNVKEALSTIRPDIIKKINVYEYKSTESKYSGFEDLNGGKTVNIITKRQKDALMNGEVSSGLGKENRYAVDANINRFSEKSRLNFTGGTKSIEVPVRLNQGSSKQTIAGNELKNKYLRYSQGIIGKHDVNVSYGFNKGQMDNYSTNSQDYIAGALKGQSNNSDNSSTGDMSNHQLGINYRNQSNEKHQLSISANLSSALNKGSNFYNSNTYQNENLINSNKRINSNDTKNERMNSRLNYSRRLNEKSAISTNLNISASNINGAASLRSETTNESNELVQEVDQVSNNNAENISLNYGLFYNYKLSKKSHLNIGYSFNLNQGDSKKQSFDYDPIQESYSVIDSLTSSDFNTLSSSHRGKIALKKQHKKSNIYLGMNITGNYLESQENFPDKEHFKENFLFFEPQVKYSLRMKKSANLQLNYGMSSQNPSLHVLQGIVDNSNPLYISSGNPELKSSRTHQARWNYSKTFPTKGTFISIGLKGNLINNKIAQDRVVAQNDTIILGSYFLPAGGQFSQSINIDGHYSVSLNGMFGFTLKKLKSKMNLQTNITYGESPNVINHVISSSQRLNVFQNINLTSNISEKIDFTFSNSSNYSFVENRNSARAQSNYYSQNNSVFLYYNFYKKFIFKTNTGYSFSSASGNLESNSRLYINLSFSTKLFKNNNGELMLTAFDLAHEQVDLVRYTDEFSIYENYQPTLNKFYMLTFAYRL